MKVFLHTFYCIIALVLCLLLLQISRVHASSYQDFFNFDDIPKKLSYHGSKYLIGKLTLEIETDLSVNYGMQINSSQKMFFFSLYNFYNTEVTTSVNQINFHPEKVVYRELKKIKCAMTSSLHTISTIFA